MQHTIKVTFTDGNSIITRINGTADEISGYYAQSNVYAHEANMAQVKRIEYIESEYLQGRSSFVYLFADYDNCGILQ
jgi:hypothetical protein